MGLKNYRAMEGKTKYNKYSPLWILETYILIPASSRLLWNNFLHDMKIIIPILAILLLSSCTYSAEEIAKQEYLCKIQWKQMYVDPMTLYCDTKQDTELMKCIKEFTNGLYVKYDNPDTVSNLREDEFSNVVKACNEVFGEKK